jgi:hypothetical protein
MTFYVAVLGRPNAAGQRAGKVLASREDETWLRFKDRVKRQRGSVIGGFVTEERDASRFLAKALSRPPSRGRQ